MYVVWRNKVKDESSDKRMHQTCTKTYKAGHD